MLATTINQLNEKGIKYKVVQEGANLSVVFGLIVNGQKSKIEVFPGESDIEIRVLEAQKQVDETGFGQFLDTFSELKAIQEKEAQLIESLKA